MPSMVRTHVDELALLLAREPLDLARAALVVARLEYPDLDPLPYLARLERIGESAKARFARLPNQSVRERIGALNRLVFQEEGFTGNLSHYDDYRNSLLNVVLDRRLGIPITLALVYMEVARRAGLEVLGVSFPGHFLMRAPLETRGRIILDPFNGGAELDERDCRVLLSRHLGDDRPLDRSLLRSSSPRQMLARMLNNLKRTYIGLRCFPQARMATDLLMTVEPTLLSELRDRGLLSYHLDDFPAALRDLEDYLRLYGWKGEDDQDERGQLVEHVKTLRRRVASMN